MTSAVPLVRSWQLGGAPSRNPGVCSGPPWIQSPGPAPRELLARGPCLCLLISWDKRVLAPSRVQKRPWICRNWWLWAVFPCRAVPPAHPEQDLGAESPKQSPWVWGAATQPLLPSHIIGVNIGVLGHGRVSWGWGKEHELRKETLGL